MDKLLTSYDEAFPTLFDWSTLVKESRSIQEASPIHPRTIVFGEEGEVFLTFNGEQSQRGYQTVEVVKFLIQNAKRVEYHYEEADFLKLPNPIQSRPAKCLRCHYIPFRPIWEAYKGWPGTYGEDNDFLIDYENDKYAREDNTKQVVENGIALFNNFQSFMDLKPDHPRYRLLKFPEGSPVSPFRLRGIYVSDRFRPNLKLTKILTRQNALRMVSMLRKNDRCFERYKELLVANLLVCQALPSQLSRMENALKETRTHLKLKYPWKEGEKWNYSGDAHSSPDPSLPSLMGVEKEDWHLGESPQVWSYFDGEVYLEDWVADEIIGVLRNSRAMLPPYSAVERQRERIYGNYLPKGGDEPEETDSPEVVSNRARERMCGTLLDLFEGKKTRRELEGACLEPPSMRENEIPLSVQMCLSCHGAPPEGNAPSLPLQDRQALLGEKVLIPKILERIFSRNKENRMPPQRFLSDRERREILHHLNGSGPHNR